LNWRIATSAALWQICRWPHTAAATVEALRSSDVDLRRAAVHAIGELPLSGGGMIENSRRAATPADLARSISVGGIAEPNTKASVKLAKMAKPGNPPRKRSTRLFDFPNGDEGKTKVIARP
jgi:hypothetical protein